MVKKTIPPMVNTNATNQRNLFCDKIEMAEMAMLIWNKVTALDR